MSGAAGPSIAAHDAVRAPEEILRSAWSRARDRHGAAVVDFERFAAHALEVTRRRLGSAAPAEVELSRALQAAALEDLALGLSCALGMAGAWERLQAQLFEPLCAAARRKGATPAEAEVGAREVLGDLSRTSEGTGRSPLAAYAGAGSLLGWTTSMLLRRLARQQAGRREDPTDFEAGAPADPASADPSAAAEAAELGSRLDRSMSESWQRLTAGERVALLAKYRDGLAQTDIARLLDVGAPRVTRLVQSAVAKLREAVRGVAALVGRADDPRLWSAMTESLSIHLATRRETAPPISGGHRDRAAG